MNPKRILRKENMDSNRPPLQNNSFEVGHIDNDIQIKEHSDLIMENFQYLTCPLSFNPDSRPIKIPLPIVEGPSEVTDEETDIKNIRAYKLCWAAANNKGDDFVNALQEFIAERTIPSSTAVPDLPEMLLPTAIINENKVATKCLVNYDPQLLNGISLENSLFHSAAESGHLSMINALIDLYRDHDIDRIPYLEKQNSEGNTALHASIIYRHQDVAVFLIDLNPRTLALTNNEHKTPLYLAAEAGYQSCVKNILEKQVEGMLEGKSPIHPAIVTKNKEIWKPILDKNLGLIDSIDENGSTPLHCAASIGYVEGVVYLLKRHNLSAIRKDKYGCTPLQQAAVQGHVDVVDKMLEDSPWLIKIFDAKDRSLLHLAAEHGKLNVVNFVLKKSEFRFLINSKDRDGNTPLHLATKNKHSKIVSVLSWDKTVKLDLQNNKGFTALDIAFRFTKYEPSFKEKLIIAALRSAGAPHHSDGALLAQDKVDKYKAGVGAPNSAGASLLSDRSAPPQVKADLYRDRVSTLLLVSTLIVTITFAAGITFPGGLSSSDGTATLLHHILFQVFTICTTIAMYSSITSTITFMWATLGDVHLVSFALKIALPLLAIALTTMSVAFMTGLFLVVRTLPWLSILVLVLSSVFTTCFLSLFSFLILDIDSKNKVMRYINYPAFYMMLNISEWF